MRKTEVTPNYKMSNANLAHLGRKGVSLYERDQAELATYGIDDGFRDTLEDLTKQVEDFPTDEELQADVSDATDVKDTKAEEVRTAIRPIMARAHDAFKEHPAKIRRFGTKGMDDLPDIQLHRLASRVVRTATLFLSELASKGLTLAIINDLKDKNDALNDAIDAKVESEEDRDNATEDRIILGNLLYAKIVEMFNDGKSYWVDKSEAKYNDYVIYDTPTITPPSPQ
ncbi:MAG: hypothetical protein WCH34_00715 [Bacteroidota bacterium]